MNLDCRKKLLDYVEKKGIIKPKLAIFYMQLTRGKNL